MSNNIPADAVRFPSAKLRSAERGVTSFTVTLLATSLLSFLPSSAFAMPLRYSFVGLARASDMIVVARVESIRGSRVLGNRWATANVREVWKGPKTETVKFLASPRRESWTHRMGGCDDPDITDAKEGELVLLFLTKEKNVGWVILNKGRGRMPLITRNGKDYSTHVPDKMPTVGIPDGHLGFIPAVELSALRELVKKAAQNAEQTRPPGRALRRRVRAF